MKSEYFRSYPRVRGVYSKENKHSRGLLCSLSTRTDVKVVTAVMTPSMYSVWAAASFKRAKTVV